MCHTIKQFMGVTFTEQRHSVAIIVAVDVHSVHSCVLDQIQAPTWTKMDLRSFHLQSMTWIWVTSYGVLQFPLRTCVVPRKASGCSGQSGEIFFWGSLRSNWLFQSEAELWDKLELSLKCGWMYSHSNKQNSIEQEISKAPFNFAIQCTGVEASTFVISLHSLFRFLL